MLKLEGDSVETTVEHEPPRMGGCPAGGDHAPIPIQGGGGNQCAKCGQSC